MGLLPDTFIIYHISLILKIWHMTHMSHDMTQQIRLLATTEILKSVITSFMACSCAARLSLFIDYSFWDSNTKMLNTLLYHKYNFNIQLECQPGIKITQIMLFFYFAICQEMGWHITVDCLEVSNIIHFKTSNKNVTLNLEYLLPTNTVSRK